MPPTFWVETGGIPLLPTFIVFVAQVGPPLACESLRTYEGAHRSPG